MAAMVVACASMLHSTAAPTAKNTTTGWQPCPSSISSKVDCIDISVPLDYDHPHGESISLKLLRLNALNQNARVGSLVFQFGGPGVVGSTALLDVLEDLTPAAFGGFVEYFDIVIADPRGVGINHAVECDPKYEGMKLNWLPRNEDEYTKEITAFQKMGESCVERTGKIINYMDSMIQARDLEAVRIAIGEGGLNYCNV